MSGIFAAPQRHWTKFIDAAARACEDILDRLSPPRRLTIVEEDGGMLTVTRANNAKHLAGAIMPDATGKLVASGREMQNAAKGAHIDLVLRPDRFLIRDLPLPAQADGFLERILRAQIDRWTPWPAERAVFGYLLREQTADRIVVAVAAGDRHELQPLFDGFAALKPRMLSAFAGAVDGGPRIPLMTQNVAARRHSFVRNLLGGALLLVSLGLLGIFAWTAWAGAQLDRDYEALQADIAGKRAGLRSEDPIKEIERRIITRKAQGPFVSIMLEELTRVLPDDTSVTDIQLTGTKLQIIGVSRDATALIGLIEKSAAFSDAGFYAPTTRGALDPAEQFHIEAKMKAGRGVRP